MIRVSNQESGPCFFNRAMFRVFFPIPSSFLISNVGNLFGREEKMIVATFPRISKTRCAMEKKEEGREGRGLEFNGLSSGEGEGPR